MIGAPEFVLREDYAEYKDRIEAYSEKGYRVLVYGRYEGILDGQQLTEKVLPIAFIMLTNAIREGAKETFSYFTERGGITLRLLLKLRKKRESAAQITMWMHPR